MLSTYQTCFVIVVAGIVNSMDRGCDIVVAAIVIVIKSVPKENYTNV